jgi:hypothetical protein
MSGLLRSSRAVMLLAVLVAVVGVSGTAYANKGSSGDKKGAVAAGKQLHKLTVSHGGRIHKSHKAHKSHKKHNGDNDNDGNHGDNNQGDDHHGDNNDGDDHHGDNGDHHGAEYGIATVSIKRGAPPASVWATYSTLLGSPVGDNTGGVFRFTCNVSQAPCEISVKAWVTAGTKGVYPRLLIYKQDAIVHSSPTEDYCEYLDGPGNAVTTASTVVPLAAGGSFDCGTAEVTDHVDPNFGQVVNSYFVGAGYYDVHSTFVFVSLP